MNALLAFQQRRAQSRAARAKVMIGMNMADLSRRSRIRSNILLSYDKPYAPGSYSVPAPVDANGDPTTDFSVKAVNGPTYSGLPRAPQQGWAFGSFASYSLYCANAGAYQISNVQYDPNQNLTTWNYTDNGTGGTGAAEGNQAFLTFTGTRRTGGPGAPATLNGQPNTGLVNVGICAPGCTRAQVLAGKAWTDEGVAFGARFPASLRFMDAQPVYGADFPGNNNDQQTTWAGPNRTRMSSNSFADLLKLAVAANGVPWFCIGFLWTDQAVLEFVTWLHGAMPAQMVADLEYGNELWNDDFANTHVNYRRTCVEVKGFIGGESSRGFTYGRSAGVMTVTTTDDHLWSTSPLYFTNVGGLDGPQPIQTLPTARSATFNSPGADVPAGTGLGSSSWVVQNLSTLGQDGNTNIYSLAARYNIRRAMQISEIVRSVVGDAAMNKRIRMVYADFMGGDPQYFCVDRWNWLSAQYPQRAIGQLAAASNGAYFESHAGAPYYPQLGTSQGDVVAHAGATVAQIAAATLDAAANCKYVYFYERRIMEARVRGLRSRWYEGGPDTGTARYLGGNDLNLRTAAQYDPAAGTAADRVIRDWLSLGADEALWYHNGIGSPEEDGGTTGQYAWANFARSVSDVSSASPKAQAIEALRASGVAVRRNPLPTVIGQSVTFTTGTSEGQYGGADIGPRGWQEMRMLLNALVDGTYSLSYVYSCTTSYNSPKAQVFSGLAAVGSPLQLIKGADHTVTHASPTYSLGPIKKGPWMMRLVLDQYSGANDPNIDYHGFTITRTA